MRNAFILCAVITVMALSGIIFLLRQTNTSQNSQPQSNVTIVDGKQTIQLNAKAGYAPRNTTASANLPTVLKVNTNGTFDCSSSISIPSLAVRKNLPPSGTTDIQIPPQSSGTTLTGTCAMGMYNFAIAFK